MDPAGLLACIATIAHSLDGLSETYRAASSTLSHIRLEIGTSETKAQRIHEWLHFTDPTSKTQGQHGLQRAFTTVNASLQRLSHDLETLGHTRPETASALAKTASNRWVEPRFPYNEERMRKHLTDARECASLLHFALNVCQLPVDTEQAKLEAIELEIGARAVQRAQTTLHRDARRRILEESEFEYSGTHSVDYSTFMRQVIYAEAGLLDNSPAVNRENSVGFCAVEDAQVDSSTSFNSLVTNGMLFKPCNDLSLPEVTTHNLPLTDIRSAPSLPPSVEPPALRTTSPPINQSLAPKNGKMIGNSKGNGNVSRSGCPAPSGKTSEAPAFTAIATASAVKRKPVSRTATSELIPASSKAPVYSEQPPRFSARSTSSPATYQVRSIVEKLNPLTQSLQSLGTGDYLHVELDQALVQPYADNPPSYAVSTSSLPDVLSIQKAETLDTSLVDDSAPVVLRLARENRIDDLREHLSLGSNANETDSRTGRTALMEACRLRRWDACHMLIQSGSRVNLKDSDGNTALHLAAAEGGDTEVFEMLFLAGSHSEDFNGDGKTPLTLALQGGHSEAVICLLDDLFSRLKKDDEVLIDTFLESIKRGDVASTQAFLAKGFKPKKIKDPWRPIAYAVQSGSVPMLELLLTQKCSVKEQSPAGWTPLHFAASSGHQHMVAKLLSLKVPWKSQTKKTEETALHLAAASGNTAVAMALITHKDANVTMKDADNQEPIHHAFRQGDLKLVTALMDQGAKPLGQSKFGWKPIHLAAAYGHQALVADLMTRNIGIGEKLSAPSFKPEKQTNEAARRGYWAEIRWPHPGARPLHLALEFARDDIADMLIAGGAKLEESDTYGWRALHYAAFNGRDRVVETLLQRGVSPEAKTDDGNTALTLGFREYGLNATRVQCERVVEHLQVAIATQRRSKLKEVRRVFGSGKQSKVVMQRNLVWHRAQLADGLYQSWPIAEGEEEESTEDAEENDLSRVASETAEEGLY